MTTLELSKKYGVVHRDIIRSVKKLIKNGVSNSEFIPDTFVNKMNRIYPMYHLTAKSISLIEGKFEFRKTFSLPSIYIIECNGKHKIGFSTNVNSRITAIQTANPEFVEIVLIINNVNKELETELHQKYANYHYSGEWYSLNSEIINEISNIYSADVHLTLNDLIFDLWHESPDKTPELTISDFTLSRNFEVLKKLKQAIEFGMKEKLHYKQIYQIAKDEVNNLADSLNFNRKSLKHKNQ